MLIDTHSHLNFSDYNKDREQVIQRALNNNIWMINIGTDFQTSQQVVEIAGKYEQGVYAGIGLHPMDTDQDFDYEKYYQLAQSSDKVVAIGEIGLDYWNKPKTKGKTEEFKNQQKQLLLKQLKLTEDLGLPVIFHCRKSHNDLIQILEESKIKIFGVIHCFTGDWDQAQKYLDLGLYLGFNGIIYKLDLTKIIKQCPVDKILVETDCPFLTPSQANIKRNESSYIIHIIKTIADIKNQSFDKIAEVTTTNAKKLFRL